MELFTAIKYIQYILFSGHMKGHGIHSPFVYELISRIFRNKTLPVFVNRVESIRKEMESDPRSIMVDDLGSGSRRMKGKERSISDITRYSAIPGKYGILLSKMAAAYGDPLILEFGTSLGISTMYLAGGCPEIPVFTMEGCSATSSVAAENFARAGFGNINLMTGSFESLLPFIAKKKVSPGLVFIDGDHRLEKLTRYFSMVSDMAGQNTVVVIDDIYSGKEMYEAWALIKAHPMVSVTVDIFRMGLVFFRKGIAKTNCVVRY